MNITLLGATGKTGAQVLTQALEAGHEVTTLVRSPSKLTITNPNLKVIHGNATDVSALAEAMAGNEVLISTLGSMKDTALIAKSTKAIIAAAQIAGLKRVIMMSSFAVKRDSLNGVTKFVTGLAMKKVVADKSVGEAALRTSGLAWTIVYATVLSNGTKGAEIHVMPADKKLGIQHKIARADVAAWMLQEAKDANYIGEDVTISQ